MTQSRSSGPKQERRHMSRHGISRGCLQPNQDDKAVCRVWHCSDRMQDPSGGGPDVSVCVARISLLWELKAQQFEKFCCKGEPVIV